MWPPEEKKILADGILTGMSKKRNEKPNEKRNEKISLREGVRKQRVRKVI